MTTMTNIIGIGTDILEIDRFKKAVEAQGQPFLDKVFTKSEQAYCNRYNNPFERFTARFCAKEAIAKSLGHGFGEHINFQDIEITNNPSGKPIVTLSEKCAAYFKNPTFHLSLSHCKHYATATAIAHY
jgi:holo-[acyl-carrier protein] synthase